MINLKKLANLSGIQHPNVKTSFRSPLKGVIRREDVRQTEKDRVELSKCFRPGDIVLARIISLGDSNNYLLSTAGDELGMLSSSNNSILF